MRLTRREVKAAFDRSASSGRPVAHDGGQFRVFVSEPNPLGLRSELFEMSAGDVRIVFSVAGACDDRYLELVAMGAGAAPPTRAICGRA